MAPQKPGVVDAGTHRMCSLSMGGDAFICPQYRASRPDEPLGHSAFVRLRELIATNKDIAARVEKLERNHDRTASVSEVLVEDIDRLGRKVEQIKPPSPYSRRRIGYITEDD